MRHLGVLREADLVVVERQGLSRVNHLNPVPVQRIHRRWVAEFEQPWAMPEGAKSEDVPEPPAVQTG